MTEIFEHITSLLGYAEDKPLIFTRAYFWYFYAVVLFFFGLLYKRMRLRNADRKSVV